jgi:hypothetical protein
MHDAQSDAIDRYLGRLPTATPPARLKARIAQRLRWRQQRWPLLAAAAALALAALLPGLLPRDATLPSNGGNALHNEALAEIRSLDRQLQLAYAGTRGGSAASVEALWQARAVAMRRLDDPTAPPPRLVRL